MEFLYDFLVIAVYSVLGIALMVLGNFIIDLIIPCHFPTEIKKGNQAVGWLSAGSFAGIGLILRSAIMSPAAEEAETSLAAGIGSSVLYFVMGIIMFLTGYLITAFINKKYNLNEEIGKGNTAAGIFVFGIFIGLALIISGAVA